MVILDDNMDYDNIDKSVDDNDDDIKVLILEGKKHLYILNAIIL